MWPEYLLWHRRTPTVAVGLPIVRGIEIIENQNQISSEDNN